MSFLRPLFVSLYFSPARSYGGPVASLSRLVDELASLGDDCYVVTTNADGHATIPAGVVTRSSGARVRYCRRIAGELFAPSALFFSVGASRTRSPMYIWGIFVWLLPALLVVARLRGIALVVSPRGMLYRAAMERRSWRKIFFLRVLRRLGLEDHALFHLTAESEIASVREHFPEARWVNLPNGVDACEAIRTRDRGRYLLFLGRVDPIKRIELIIRAYAIARQTVRGPTRLVIAGAGDNSYVAQLRALAREMDLAMDIDFRGYVEGDEKNSWLASASAVVLCSKSENFGMAIAEALAAGTPVIATTTTPWSAVVEKKVGWFVDDSERAIAEAMRAALTLPADEISQISNRAKAWVREDFGWPSIARRMRDVFCAEIDLASKRA